MIENGFYKLKQEFIQLINDLGGYYQDKKERPVFCCIEDKYIRGLFWAIPTSDVSHRSPDQLAKIRSYCNLDINRDIRGCYYHLARTNRSAIYRITSCLPITDKYIAAPYFSQGRHLILGSKNDIAKIRTKLARILLDESNHPNKYEQHITDIPNYLIDELG